MLCLIVLNIALVLGMSSRVPIDGLLEVRRPGDDAVIYVTRIGLICILVSGIAAIGAFFYFIYTILFQLRKEG